MLYERPEGGERQGKPVGAELNASISRAVVRIHRARLGRGPSTSQAFFRHNVVVVLLEGSLTRAERSLIASGQPETVLQLRQQLLESMREDLVTAVEHLTGRHVMALLGDTNVEPDLTCEIFVLDQPVET